MLLSGFLLTEVFPATKSAFFWWLTGAFVVMEVASVFYRQAIIENALLWIHRVPWAVGAFLLLDGTLLAFGWSRLSKGQRLIFYLPAYFLAALGLLTPFLPFEHDNFLIFWNLAALFFYMALRRDANSFPDGLPDTLPTAWLIVNPQGKILQANRHASQILRTSLHQMIGQPVAKYLPGWQRLQDGKSYAEYEIQQSHNLDPKRILQVYQMADANLLLQILDGKQSEETIRAHQQNRRLLFERLFVLSDLLRDSDGIEHYLESVLTQLCVWYNADGGVAYLDQSLVDELLPSTLVFTASFAVPVENFPPALSELDGDLDTLLQHPDAVLVSNQALETFGFGETTAKNVLLLPLASGQRNIGAIFLFFRQEVSSETLLLLEQISTRIAQLLTWNQQQQRWGALRERQRLMENLHGVMQHFYAAALYTDSMAAAVQNGNHGVLPDLLQKLQDTLRQSVRDIRLILYSLDKNQIEKTGLQKAILRRLEKVELSISGISVMADLDESITLPPLYEKALYYIAMEALNNALRHAQASHVVIRLYRGKSAIILRVRDNGKGFRNTSKGLGFFTMKERARLLGGNLWIHSTPGKGTVLVAALPLPDANNVPARMPA